MQEDLELPGRMVRRGSERDEDEGQSEVQEDVTGAENREIVPYDSKPPAWAVKICVT